MKKLLSLILLQIILISPVLADNTQTITIRNITTDSVINNNIESEIINRKDIFNFYANFFSSVIPESYKYIQLKYSDVQKSTELYNSLQVLVYYDLIDNKEWRLYPLNNVSAYSFYLLSEKILWINLITDTNEEVLKSRYSNQNDLILINKQFNIELNQVQTWWISSDVLEKKEIFEDVYELLSSQHYEHNEFSETQLINKAIEWLAEWTWDKHTTYFPPTEKTEFQNSLSWEFEWIWAYVEMEKPGKFMIISPITNSPAYNAWLKWWDQVIKVWDKEIKEENSAEEVISWIKWEKWTSVTLTIKRGNKTLEFEVIRDKIVIDDIETELVNSRTFLISIRSFWQHVSENFNDALIELSEEKYVKKIIIDLRNNGGWYLDQVAEMLSYIVPEGEKTAVIKYLNWQQNYRSAGYELINFNDYQIVILQNSGTASASEILAGTIKDYFPEATLIWEQSYGKWSVQRLKEYSDGSLLKYTIARWYTGWNEISIDGVWLTPDILLEFDSEQYEKYKTDNQLKKAINLK